ncbi:MAG: transposase [Lachnospiraceae bacterium]|nr:transposase [Lachnospiraceae bacterium]
MNQISQEKPKQVLFSIINSLLDNRDEFLVNPQSDFTRSKKITFSQTILFPMIAGSDNVATELLDYFGENNPPLPSAMIQRRNQVKPEAFKELFLRFTLNIPKLQTFHGYQLVSVDGSRINLPYSPSDESSFIHSIKGRKGINQVHLNALYDPLNDIFLDAILQGIHEMDEKAAFTTFLDQNDRKSGNKIFLADRGYASYNIFAHAIHNQELFLIRLPESFAKAICPNRERWLEGDYSDENVTINIGRNRKKKNLQLENYHCIPKSGHYDYIEAGTDNIDTLKMRILKFPIAEDFYEYIVTNLPAYAFSLSTIKNLYNLRWQIMPISA